MNTLLFGFAMGLLICMMVITVGANFSFILGMVIGILLFVFIIEPLLDFAIKKVLGIQKK